MWLRSPFLAPAFCRLLTINGKLYVRKVFTPAELRSYLHHVLFVTWTKTKRYVEFEGDWIMLSSIAKFNMMR